MAPFYLNESARGRASCMKDISPIGACFLATVNLLYEDEDFYDAADLELGAPFAALLIPAFGQITGTFF